LPVIVLAGAANDATGTYYARGASDVVTGDWRSGDFKNRIRTHAKLQRMRSKMLAAYGRAMPLVTSDSLTGLSSHGYLHAHLATQIKDVEHRGHDLSVGFFRVSELRDINETFGYPAGDKVLRQIGTILSRIVRGEDLPARYSGNEFCVVFPDTATETAQRIVLRIKSVIETTELAVSDMDRAANVLIDAATASLDHGRDTAKTLIGRARKALKS
jgi:two-component system cell cycle response regulator